MFTLELSSYVLEIHNHAYTTLAEILLLFNSQSRVLQADWLILGNNGNANLNINMPNWPKSKSLTENRIECILQKRIQACNHA